MKFLKKIKKYIASSKFALKNTISWSFRLRKKQTNKSFTLRKPKLYKTIDDLPAWNYAKILETGKTYYLRKDGKEQGEFNEQMQAITNQLIDTFGFSQDFKYYINKERSRVMLICRMYATGDQSLVNKIKYIDNELKHIDLEKKDNLFSLLPVISKHVGFQVDMKKTSIRLYYEYLEQIKRSVTAN